MSISSKREDAFSGNDQEIFQRVASQVAIAAANAMAVRELEALKDKLAQEKLYLEDEIRTELNFDEIVEVIFGRRPDVEDEVALLAELIPLAKNEYARSAAIQRTSYRQIEPEGGRYTVDTPVPYRIDQLVALAEARMGKLENHAVAVQYQRLLLRINTVRKNPRYSFIFDETSGDDAMVDIL